MAPFRRFAQGRPSPLALVAIVIGVAAVALVCWPYLVPGSNPQELAAKVNAAYRDVPGFTWTMTQTGELSRLRTTRVTQLDDGRVVGLTEEVGVPGDRPLQTIVTADRIWITYEGRGCWTAGGPPTGRGLGGPVIPTTGVRFEKARRTSAGWRLVGHQTLESVTLRLEYIIDPATFRVVRMTRDAKNLPLIGDSTVTMTFSATPTAPAIVAPTVICPGR